MCLGDGPCAPQPHGPAPTHAATMATTTCNRSAPRLTHPNQGVGIGGGAEIRAAEVTRPPGPNESLKQARSGIHTPPTSIYDIQHKPGAERRQRGWWQQADRRFGLDSIRALPGHSQRPVPHPPRQCVLREQVGCSAGKQVDPPLALSHHPALTH